MRNQFLAALLAAGLAVAPRIATAQEAPAPAADLVQLVQYYGGPGYYGRPGFYPHRRFYGRPFFHGGYGYRPYYHPYRHFYGHRRFYR